MRVGMAKIFKNLIILGILGFLYSPAPLAAQTAPVAILDWPEAGPSKSQHLVFSDVALSEARIAAVESPKPLDLTIPLPFERPVDNAFGLASLSSSAATNPRDRPASSGKFHFWPSFGESVLYTGSQTVFAN
jgi:hypothetical protein